MSAPKKYNSDPRLQPFFNTLGEMKDAFDPRLKPFFDALAEMLVTAYLRREDVWCRAPLNAPAKPRARKCQRKTVRDL